MITREYLRNNRNKIFVFGDNELHIGHGGAAVLRDEPNTYGFITKKKPDNCANSFYTVDEYRSVYDREIKSLIGCIELQPHLMFMISRVGAGLVNKYGIFEAIIEPNIKIDLAEYANVTFLW